MHEIKFGPSLVVPTGPANLPRRWGADHEPLGVGSVCCSCRRAGVYGRLVYDVDVDNRPLHLPNLMSLYPTPGARKKFKGVTNGNR